MDETDLQTRINRLAGSLDRIRGMLEWEQLKRSEASYGPASSFTLNDPVDTELRHEYSLFLFTWLQIQHILDNHTAALNQQARSRLREQLDLLQRRFHRLGLHHRFTPASTAG